MLFKLVWTNKEVGTDKQGNETLLGKTAWSVNQDHPIHGLDVVHQVPYVLDVGDVERLYVIGDLHIGKALHVTLSFFIDSLLAITINDKNYLITK